MEDTEKKVIRELIADYGFASWIIEHSPGREKIIEMIGGAPISLERKAEMLNGLMEMEAIGDLAQAMVRFDETKGDSETPEDMKNSYTYAAEAAKEIVEGLVLKEHEIFNITLNNVIGEDMNAYSLGPAKSLKEAQDKILSKTECETGEELLRFEKDALFCVVLEKYDLSGDQCRRTSEYTLFGTEPVFFFPFEENALQECRFRGMPDLVLPFFFRPGDLVQIDCRPQAPVRSAVILKNQRDEIEDILNPRVLYINGDGECDEGGLCFNAPVEDFNPLAFSGLYSIRSIHADELLPGEESLKEISDFIKDDEDAIEYVDEYLLEELPTMPAELIWKMDEYDRDQSFDTGHRFYEKAYAYFSGDGVTVDVKKALNICRQAEKYGFNDCFYLQAQIYDCAAAGEEGNAYTESILLAEKYFLKAGERGDRRSAEWLMNYYWNPEKGNNPEKAEYWRNIYTTLDEKTDEWDEDDHIHRERSLGIKRIL